MSKNTRYCSLIATILLGFGSINQNISYAMNASESEPRGKWIFSDNKNNSPISIKSLSDKESGFNSSSYVDRNYFIWRRNFDNSINQYSNLTSNSAQRKKQNNKSVKLDLLSKVYDCKKMMSEKKVYSEDFIKIFCAQYSNLSKNPTIPNKNSQLETYKSTSSDNLKLNLLNYCIALNSKWYANHKKIVQNKEEISYLENWNKNHYLILIDALNTVVPKQLYSIIDGIINLDLKYGHVKPEELYELKINANNKLKSQIQKIIDQLSEI